MPPKALYKLSCLGLCFAWILLWVNSVSLTADTLVVKSTQDSGTGSLREAVSLAKSGDVITFPSSLDGSTIHLTTGELLIQQHLRINGPGLNKLTLSAGGRSRLFNVKASLYLEDLTLSDGDAGAENGGAILCTGRGVALRNCKVMNCQAEEGGAIYQPGTDPRTSQFFLLKCRFTGNSAGKGGAVKLGKCYSLIIASTFDHNSADNGGALWLEPSQLSDAFINSARVNNSLWNCTFSANSATEKGAAMVMDATSAEIRNCTVFDNEGESSIHGANSALCQFKNTVVAKTRSYHSQTLTMDFSSLGGFRCGLEDVFFGNNGGVNSILSPSLSSNQRGPRVGSPGQMLDPMLAPLELVGDMPVHKPMPGSPLIGMGLNQDSYPFNTSQLNEPRSELNDTLGSVLVIASSGPTSPSEPTGSIYPPSPRVYALIDFDRPTSGSLEGILWGSNFLDPGVCSRAPVIRVDNKLGGEEFLQFSEHRNDQLVLVPKIPKFDDFRLQVNICGKTSNFVGYEYDPIVVLSVTPSLVSANGTRGAVILGENFGRTRLVMLGEKPALVRSSTHTRIECDLPAGEGATAYLVVVAGRRQSPPYRMGYKEPVITSISPSPVLASGALTTISGSDFGQIPLVLLDGDFLPILEKPSLDKLKVQIPAGAGLGHKLIVLAADQASKPFTVDYAAPALTSSEPGEEGLFTSGGTLVLKGSDFGPTPIVLVDGMPATLLFTSDTRLKVLIRPGEGGGHRAQVISGGQASNELVFAYPSPRVASISPSTLPTSGGVAILQGNNFGSTPLVRINGMEAPVIQASHTSIVVAIPAGRGTNNVLQVLSAGQKSNNVRVDYLPPEILSLQPSTLQTIGGPVELVGANFSDNPFVILDDLSVQLISVSDTRITFGAPPGYSTGHIVKVLAGNQESNSKILNYTPPALSSLFPALQPTTGGTATVVGSNFGTAPRVLVDDKPAVVNNFSHSSVNFVVPGGSGRNHKVKVLAGNQESGELTFSYLPPTLIEHSPLTIPTPGGTINLTGMNFGPSPVVDWDGIRINPVAKSHTSITFVVPAGQGTGHVLKVVADDQVSNALIVNYAAPSLTSVVPLTISTAGGTAVLSGSNFGLNPTVVLDGNRIVPSTASHSRLTIAVTAGEGKGHKLKVAAGDLVSEELLFDYESPLISSITPTNLPTSGGFLTLIGKNFGLTPTVRVGSKFATPFFVSHTKLVYIVPEGEGKNLTVRVTAGGQESQSALFSFDPPSLTRVVPGSFPTTGGKGLLEGKNFGLNAIVFLNGNRLAPPSSPQTHTQKEILIPPGQGANHVITVQVDGQVSDTKTFSYDAPSVSSISAPSYPTDGGVELRISGSNFGLTPIVNIGATVVRPLDALEGMDPHSQLRVILPPGEGTAVPVQVSAGGISSRSVFISYDPPLVNGLSPATGSTAGGTSVFLNGSNLGQNPVVLFGTARATILSRSSDQIECRLPSASQPGSVPVIVRVGSRTSSAGQFKYVQVPVALRVSAPRNTVSFGRTLQCTAVLSFDDGRTQDVTSTATWTVSSPSAATVLGGLVSGKASGICVVSASTSGLGASLELESKPVLEFVVRTLSETGEGSLREALDLISPGGVVRFEPALVGGQVVVSSPLEIQVPLTLRGLGANQLRIKSSNRIPLLLVNTSLQVNVEGLAFSEGSPAIRIPFGRVNASRCLFEMNQGEQGGAIECLRGTFDATECLFAENRATRGGAVYVANEGTTMGGGRLIRCTFYGNRSDAEGGAVFSSGLLTTMDHCTFSGNSGPTGSAVYNRGNLTILNSTFAHNLTPPFLLATPAIWTTGLIRLRSCLIALNQGNGVELDLGSSEAGSFQSQGFNLLGSNQSVDSNFPGGMPNGNGDYVGTPAVLIDPQIGGLSNNGGFTPTHALLPGSPAVDRGTATTDQTTDQRGLPRISGAASDIGSYEFQIE